MIQVLPYQPEWAAAFDIEAARITAALGSALLRVHHIGSTAVPQTKAKPVIDILLEVGSLEALDQRTPELESLGYETMGEFGIPSRRYFRLNDACGKRTYQAHAFEAGTQHVLRHLAFRDYLRAHPARAVEYGETKIRLAERYRNDMSAYISGKDAFVKLHERHALRWAAETGLLGR